MASLNNYIATGLFALLALLLSACGESGLIADGGIRGTGKSVGPVSGFGSVIVNGVRYETDAAEIIVNDTTVTQAALAEGMLVMVEVADDDESEAARITYEDDLRGPLAGPFDPRDKVIEVLGQTVRIDSATVFRGLSPEQLALALEGDSDRVYVRISGWRLDSGEFLASFVSSREGFDPIRDSVKIRAAIDSFNLPQEIFQIGNLSVEFAQNPEVRMNFERNELLATDQGAFVDVEGFLDGVTGNLVARQIFEEARIESFDDIDDTKIRIEGAITRGLDRAPSGTLEINGIKVRVNPATDLDGMDREDLQQGRRVFITGVGNTQATVVAKEIENREPDAEVASLIQAIDPLAANPEREGWLLVGGVRVKVNLRALVVEARELPGSGYLRFQDLREGDFVEVAGVPRATAQGDAYIEALKVERDLEDTFEIRGVVDSVGNNVFTVLGAALNVDVSTEFGIGLGGFAGVKKGLTLVVVYEIDHNGTLRAIRVDEGD